jgi:hypothetical protein
MSKLLKFIIKDDMPKAGIFGIDNFNDIFKHNKYKEK